MPRDDRLSNVPTRAQRKKTRSQVLREKPEVAERALEKAELQRKALVLRKQKATYDEIARALGLQSPMRAWRIVQEAIAQIPVEAAAEVKVLEIEDCRADLLAINHRIAGERLSTRDLFAAYGTKIKLREQLAKYMGLYAPVRTEVSGKDGGPIVMVSTADLESMTDEQLEQLVAGGRSGKGVREAALAAPPSREAGEPH